MKKVINEGSPERLYFEIKEEVRGSFIGFGISEKEYVNRTNTSYLDHIVKKYGSYNIFRKRMEAIAREMAKEEPNEDYIVSLLNKTTVFSEKLSDLKPAKVLKEPIVTYQEVMTREFEPKPGRYLLTSLVCGEEYDAEMVNQLLAYCKRTGTTPIFLVQKAINHAVNYWRYSQIKDVAPYLYGKGNFNSNLSVIAYNSLPTQHNQSGIDTFVKKRIAKNSVIVPHITQTVSSLQSGVGKLPHLIFTTGTASNVIWNPGLNTHSTAQHYYVKGGLILSVTKKERFFVTQFEWNEEKKGFYSLGKFEGRNKSQPVRGEALVVGDLHAGKTDPKARKATFEIIAQTRPREVYLHDAFDGASLNHHEEKRFLTNAKKNIEEKSLTLELNVLAEEMKLWADMAKKYDFKINIVASNHDEWLIRSLEREDFHHPKYTTSHTEDISMVAEMRMWVLQNKYPLEEYFRKYHPKLTPYLVFLRRDTIKTATPRKILLSAHGDKGVNGTRAGFDSYRANVGYCAIGHAHTTRLDNMTVQVGCICILNPDYTKGSPSTWTHSVALINEDGSHQVYIIVEGEWSPV